jgi:uncharacterized membrane protein YkgB
MLQGKDLFRVLSISIGLVYLWFGMLKFFPEGSPAEGLAIKTINFISFELISPRLGMILLALWETLVGVLLILFINKKPVLTVALVHQVFTFVPLIFFVDDCFVNAPYGFTLLGQYIFKNIIIVSALLVLLQRSKTD